MQHPKPRVEFSKQFHKFADDLIGRVGGSDNPKVRIPRRTVNALAADYGFTPLTNPNQRALRELMGERGYKIQIGADACFISRLPVTNVEPDQWPAIIENICMRLKQLFVETNEKLLRLSPAKFRNVATIWPNDNPAFNQACVDEMQELGYTMVFRVNYIDVCKIGDESKPGKRKPNAKQAEPLVEVANGRRLLEAALHPRRVGWRKGFSHALVINVKSAGDWASTALSRALLHMPSAVLDINGESLHTIALNHGDVLLVNEAAYELVKGCRVKCIDSGSTYDPDILARPLHKESANV
jgi:hypothetical protein